METTMSVQVRRSLATLAFAASMLGTASAQSPISLDVRDLDIYDAVRLLATQSGVNVVVDSSVAHRPVTLRLQNVSFDQALQTLAQSNDLETAHVGNVTYLGTADVINRRYPSSITGAQTTVFPAGSADPTELTKALTDALPRGTVVEIDKHTGNVVVRGSKAALERARDLVTMFGSQSNTVQSVIPMRYAKAADALKALEATLPNSATANAFASDQQNEIVLSGPQDYVTQASAMIEKVDRPGQQVRYDVRVTDLSPSETSNIGFLIGGNAGNGSFATSFTSNSYLLNAQLNALVTENQAKVLARPSLSTLNSVQATLLVGQQYPIVYFDARTGTQQVQFVNIGVNLMVTPTIGADGAITTDLETDYSQFGGNIGTFPIINTRKAQSTLRVHSGETIVIAGLFEDIDSTTVTKIPFLGDIPFLGEVFKNRVKSHVRDEIVFLITPHLVNDTGPEKSAIRTGIDTQ
jgi:type IV pilus assembly protein PilQ